MHIHTQIIPKVNKARVCSHNIDIHFGSTTAKRINKIMNEVRMMMMMMMMEELLQSIFIGFVVAKKTFFIAMILK